MQCIFSYMRIITSKHAHQKTYDTLLDGNFSVCCRRRLPAKEKIQAISESHDKNFSDKRLASSRVNH